MVIFEPSLWNIRWCRTPWNWNK